MPSDFSPIVGAQGFQQSNPIAIGLAALLGSLQLFKEAGMMRPIRERSIQLTNAFEKLLIQSKYFVPPTQAANAQGPAFTIITPLDPESRGAQLSLLFLPLGTGVMRKIFAALTSYGVIGDERDPNVIRLAPIPLYNTIRDCEQAVLCLDKAFEELRT